MRWSHNDKSPFATRQQISLRIANLRFAKSVSPLFPFLPTFDDDFQIDRNGLPVLDRDLGGHRTLIGQFRKLAHGFIEHHGDDSTVGEPGATGVIRAQSKTPTCAAIIEIKLKMKLHAGFIRSTAAEATICVLGLELQSAPHAIPAPRVLAQPGAFPAGASAFPREANRQARRLLGRSVFRSNWQIPGATYLATALARRNNGQAQTLPRALWHESLTHWHRSPAATPAINTSHLLAASNASLVAYVCATLRRAHRGGSRKSCAFW